MDFAKQIEYNRRLLVEDIFRRLEAALQPVVDALNDFFAVLFSRRLPADWREQWHAFIAEQEAAGYRVSPQSVREFEDWIEAWARYCELLPVVEAPAAPPIGGRWFAVAGELAAHAALPTTTATVLAALPPKGRPPRGRLPRSGGSWEGPRGEGTWRPNKPIVLKDGTKIERVIYRDGMPIFDEWSKGEVTIAIVGDTKFDRPQAIRAWHANGGGKLPSGFVFHHDGLVTENIKYKGQTVTVGRMQLIPEDLNFKVPHIGSASTARRVATATKDSTKRLANELNEMSLRGKGPLLKSAKRFKSLIAKQAKRIGRIIPLVGGVLVILDFKENAEAHGIGGAIIRGTPLLGDIVSLYDVASDLAYQIKSDAEREEESHRERVNRTVNQARQAAAEVTLQTFEELAGRLRITNPYFEAQSLKAPLEEYFETVRSLIWLRLENRPATYPEGTSDTERRTESPFNLNLRRAREKLEKDIRGQVEQQRQPDPGDAT
jgi:hypothetical protein